MKGLSHSLSVPRGFGLLEAIVALTLIAATGLALFSWVDTNLAEAARARDRDATARLKMAAVESMGPVNPLQEPRGQRQLSSSISVSWDAVPEGALASGAGFAGAPTGYQFQLFDASVTARDERSGGAQARFQLTLLGYRKGSGATTSN